MKTFRSRNASIRIHHKTLNNTIKERIDWIVIITIIISILRRNVFRMTANLPYGSPVNVDYDYYQTFRGCF